MVDGPVACPRCKALVLPVDHAEHDEWHNAVIGLLTQLTEQVEILVDRMNSR